MSYRSVFCLARIICVACVLVGIAESSAVQAQDRSPRADLSVVAQTSDVQVSGAERPSREATSVLDAENPDRQLHYVAGESVMLYNTPDSTRPVRRLAVTTPVHRLNCEADWCRVRTDDGKRGYLPESAISNVWIRASKSDRRVYLYRGTHLLETFKADFGYNAFSDKERRGSQRLRDHWRTPEGQFYVVRRNPNSQFYKALVLNYPTASDAQRGYKNGLVTRSERDAIIRAEESMRMPPMNTELGGWVEIHGDGTGAATNWTQGCVAVTNSDMNKLWWWAKVGTPVLVE